MFCGGTFESMITFGSDFYQRVYSSWSVIKVFLSLFFLVGGVVWGWMGRREKEISSIQRHVNCFKERRGEEVSRKETSHR